MDKAEAREILSERVNDLRGRSRRELLGYLDNPQTAEIPGRSGQLYQIETEAIWDERPGGNLRVIVSINDGGWRAPVPITDDFIVAPDGSFVGE